VADPIETLTALFDQEGRQAYFGERVSVSVHMLQAAALAEAAGAPDHLVAAALLHDVGHLRVVASMQTDVGDDHHEDVAATWLAAWFGPEVTQPIRLHVAAKRYLCSTESDYFSRLSAASVESLRRQGGAMSPAEVEKFRGQPYAVDAVAVRRWDDAAKDPTRATPEFAYFRLVLDRLQLPSRRA
jgi:gamma-butyrobetaine dioxygenase